MVLFQKEYIGLLLSAFTGEASALSSEFDWEKAVDTARKHSITSIMYYGAVNSHISQESEHMQELHRLTLQGMMKSTRQMYELKQIENAFHKEKIDYMPLKGSLIKSLYPRPEMRAMGDADILIKMDQYPQIEKIMSQLGFAYQYESDHEFVWQKTSLLVEFHKSIVPTYDKDLYHYFGDGWKLAQNTDNGCRYEMSAEDFYIYLFVHFTKHYRVAGIGIKHLLDLWVYRNAHADLNWEYITGVLEELDLDRFHQNVIETIDAWFNGGEETEVTDLITNMIFSSGQFGSAEKILVNHALQKGKQSVFAIKFDKVISSIFLPYRVMKDKYPILKRVPVLLPVMWVVRFADVFFRHNDRFMKYVQKVNEVDVKQVDENKRALQAVGLDVHSEKKTTP